VTATIAQPQELVLVQGDYIDAYDYVSESFDDDIEEDIDTPYYGGYGQAFDTYSTFDPDDYEYQQDLYS
jgi:hypothetical protein